MGDTVTIKLYYFHGEDAECDECVGMDGPYYTAPPKPHQETCKCEIREEVAEGKKDYRNLAEATSIYDVDGVAHREFNNTLFANLVIREEITVTLTGDIDCHEDIEEAFDVSSKFVAEHTFSETFEYSLPPGETVTVEAVGTFEEATLSCDVWFVGELDGEPVEVFMYTASDQVKSPMLMRLEVD